MSKRLSKRKRFKKGLKSTGQKIGAFAKSRIVTRFLPLFGLIAIFKPGPSYAFTLDDGMLEFGKSATIMAAEYKRLTKQGISAIPD